MEKSGKCCIEIKSNVCYGNPYLAGMPIIYWSMNFSIFNYKSSILLSGLPVVEMFNFILFSRKYENKIIIGRRHTDFV